MQGDPRSQRSVCNTLQAPRLARPPPRENLKNERSDESMLATFLTRNIQPPRRMQYHASR